MVLLKATAMVEGGSTEGASGAVVFDYDKDGWPDLSRLPPPVGAGSGAAHCSAASGKSCLFSSGCCGRCAVVSRIERTGIATVSRCHRTGCPRRRPYRRYACSLRLHGCRLVLCRVERHLRRLQ